MQTTPQTSTRVREIDMARGFAIVYLIAVSVMSFVYDNSFMPLYYVIDFLGSTPAAPVFFFLLGADFAYSQHTSPRQLFRRGNKLFVISILVNGFSCSLPLLLHDGLHGCLDQADTALKWLCTTDVLTFAGMALMFFAIVKRHHLSNRWIFVIAVIAYVASQLLAYFCPVDFDSRPALCIVAGLFYCSGPTAYFPLLAWIIYPVVGKMFGDRLASEYDPEDLWDRCGFGGLMLLIMMAAVILIFPGLRTGYFNDYMFFNSDNIAVLLLNMGLTLWWMSLLHYICRRHPKAGTRLAARLSHNFTSMYIMLWFVTGYAIILPFGNHLDVGPFATVGIIIAVTVVSYYLAEFYRRWW